MTYQIIKRPEVTKITGWSRSSIYRGAANGTFPKPIKLGERSSGWIKAEVEEWIESRIKYSRVKQEG